MIRVIQDAESGARKLKLLYTVAMGFCNYEELDSPDERGQYNWTEQEVSSEPQRMKCVYGAQFDGGMAERVCEANLMWMDYNGLECITVSTFLLRMLAVSYQIHILCIIRCMTLLEY